MRKNGEAIFSGEKERRGGRGGVISDGLEDDDDKDTVRTRGSVQQYDPKNVRGWKPSPGTWTSETGTKGPDIDRRMGSMDAMEGAEMDYLPIPDNALSSGERSTVRS